MTLALIFPKLARAEATGPDETRGRLSAPSVAGSVWTFAWARRGWYGSAQPARTREDIPDMTAIAGLWRFDGSGGVRQVAERMSATLEPYGPDRSGLQEERDHGLALVWRQMRVTAEDRFDRQPLAAAGGALWLVADARIDNGAELAGALGLPADGPDRVGDAGLILAAYQRWGESCVDRLAGDFAFALWDRQAGRLLLARDFLGIRPLYFAHGPGFFAFASMPKGLFAVPDVSDALDEAEIGAYLALLPAHHTRSFYRDLSRVPPGHSLTVSGEGRQLNRYWRPEEVPAQPVGDYREQVGELRRLYSRAVRDRLRVPAGMGIGSHLSAGYDSGSVTALAAAELARQDKRLTAFTAAPREGFALAAYRGRPTDESPVAAALAARFPNIDHRVIRTGPADPLRGVEQQLPAQDQPVLNPCNNVWLNAIEAEAARGRIRVMLSGAVGNMTVSYDGRPHLAQLFRRGRWLALAGVSIGMWRDGCNFKGPFRAALGPYLPRFILEWQGAAPVAATDPFVHTALSADFRQAIDLDAIARERAWDLTYRPWADGRAMRLAVLNRIDQGAVIKASLARYGVDTRDPTADRRLVDFCLALPEQHFIHEGRTSSLLRDAMEGLMPAGQLARRTRGYQAADWFEGVVAARDGLLAEIARLESSPLASRALDLPRLRALATALPDPSTPPGQLPMLTREHEVSHRLALLRGLSVGRFIRMVEGGNG
ncbi:asparagine synthetase B family protein [Ancylobacter vacuolatus]|uniref:asparagine synthase (glutamine-hydrolyzing) n=1 Tax=Ancylobacter vacuolatus TaxID=223389 RepID=A0ABU0DEH3_9HYPH|nr:asparagine synthase-related protein [Ancylobacter vacuolatus]MDQ0346815.1 asparagine synthase (glutamine-hydrolyzing) [Ancylobacter vacuolatus]